MSQQESWWGKGSDPILIMYLAFAEAWPTQSKLKSNLFDKPASPAPLATFLQCEPRGHWTAAVFASSAASSSSFCTSCPPSPAHRCRQGAAGEARALPPPLSRGATVEVAPVTLHRGCVLVRTMRRLTSFWGVFRWKKEETRIMFERALRQNPCTDTIHETSVSPWHTDWVVISLCCIPTPLFLK